MNIYPTITPVMGTSADDTISGGARSEIISAGAGNDLVYGNSGSDKIYGGSGDDILNGDAGNDVIYGNGAPKMANMTAFDIAKDYNGTLTFINEGAGFRNSLGLYKVDEQGNIIDVQIVFANASAQGSGGDLIRGESSRNIDLNTGDRVGFFIIPNGYGRSSNALSEDESYVLRDGDGNLATLDSSPPLTLYRVDDQTGQETKITGQYGAHTFHSAADPDQDYSLNGDAFPHTVGHIQPETGQVVIGFEDLWRGGDKDYDDVVLSFDIGQSNAQVLGAPKPGNENGPVSDDDIINGGSGHDSLHGRAGDDIVRGGDGHDLLKGNSGQDALYGEGGSDTLKGGKGDDLLDGGSGNDTLDGQSGDDTLFGGQGNDTLKGNNGNDTLHGESGADTLNGGSGNDTLNGDDGNDILKGGKGNDTLNGGLGTDRLKGGQGDDTLNGGEGSDNLNGGSNNDVLNGDAGKDYLNGASGDDILNGGQGNDRLYLGAGSDTATGGEGSDRFVFRQDDLDGSTDTITDFTLDLLQSDTLDFRPLDLLGDQTAQDWMDENITMIDQSTVSIDLEGTTLLLQSDGDGETLMDHIYDGILF
jgi:Ca2+-binding RTX toxin-like protein